MTTQRSGDIASIAVAFTNVRADQDYVADAVTYLVANDLSRLPNVYVISAEASFKYKPKDIDAKEMARKVAHELKVCYLLAGRVEKSDAIVRGEVQLIDAKEGREVCKEPFDLEFFELPIRVTKRVAARLGVEPPSPATQYSLNRSQAVTAVDLWMRGVALLLQSWTPERTLEAERLFSEVEVLDPGFPYLWAIFSIVLETLYLNRWRRGKADKEDRRNGKLAKNKALQLTPDDPLTYLAAGFVRRAEGDHEQALKDFDKAVTKNTSYAAAYVQKANELINLGRPWEAPGLVRFAILSLKLADQYLGSAYWVLGRAYFFMAEFSSAIPWLKKSVESRGDLTYNRIFLISAYALAGRRTDAIEALGYFNGRFPAYDVARIRANDRDVPNDNPVVMIGLRIRDIGLRLAGMR
jgi:adenylate cyclase